MNEKKIIEDLNKLDKKRGKLKKILDNIDNKKRAELAKTFLGKCYKFHNSYSGDNKWWLYIKVVGVDGTELIYEEFQETCYGEIEIKRARRPIYKYDSFPFGAFDSSYIPIDEKEFQEAKEKILPKIFMLREE